MNLSASLATLDRSPDALGNIMSTVEGTEPPTSPHHLLSISGDGPILSTPGEAAPTQGAEHLEISQKPLPLVQIGFSF